MSNEETREEGIARLVKSMVGKIGFVAPEAVKDMVELYITTAWDRGVADGARKVLAGVLPTGGVTRE